MSYHDLPQAILTHLAFTLVSVLFGLILGVMLGILLSRRPKLSKFVLPVLSVFNTIPGIVFGGFCSSGWACSRPQCSSRCPSTRCSLS